MGVIYTVADDLRDLLIPFMRGKGCTTPDETIIDAYRACYRLGAPATTLWQAGGFDTAKDIGLENEFLAAYELTGGVVEFLEAMKNAQIPVLTLSNDIAEWATRRREIHGIDTYFRGSVISGEAGVIKPDIAIYEDLCKMLDCSADECLFVDDRSGNLDGAQLAGLSTVLFSRGPSSPYRQVSDFAQLTTLILQGDL